MLNLDLVEELSGDVGDRTGQKEKSSALGVALCVLGSWLLLELGGLLGLEALHLVHQKLGLTSLEEKTQLVDELSPLLGGRSFVANSNHK